MCNWHHPFQKVSLTGWNVHFLELCLSWSCMNRQSWSRISYGVFPAALIVHFLEVCLSRSCMNRQSWSRMSCGVFPADGGALYNSSFSRSLLFLSAHEQAVRTGSKMSCGIFPAVGGLFTMDIIWCHMDREKLMSYGQGKGYCICHYNRTCLYHSFELVACCHGSNICHYA